MTGLEFDFPVASIRKKMVNDHRIFTGSAANPNVLRFLPPLNISENEIKHFTESLTKVLEDEEVHIS